MERTTTNATFHGRLTVVRTQACTPLSPPLHSHTHKPKCYYRRQTGAELTNTDPCLISLAFNRYEHSTIYPFKKKNSSSLLKGKQNKKKLVFPTEKSSSIFLSPSPIWRSYLSSKSSGCENGKPGFIIRGNVCVCICHDTDSGERARARAAIQSQVLELNTRASSATNTQARDLHIGTAAPLLPGFPSTSISSRTAQRNETSEESESRPASKRFARSFRTHRCMPLPRLDKTDTNSNANWRRCNKGAILVKGGRGGWQRGGCGSERVTDDERGERTSSETSGGGRRESS